VLAADLFLLGLEVDDDVCDRHVEALSSTPHDPSLEPQ
jgi:hypothetical protein